MTTRQLTAALVLALLTVAPIAGMWAWAEWDRRWESGRADRLRQRVREQRAEITDLRARVRHLDGRVAGYRAELNPPANPPYRQRQVAAAALTPDDDLPGLDDLLDAIETYANTPEDPR